MLGSEDFQASPKLSELLYHLVTETLGGNAERLKGYAIGLDVFGREPGFDQGVDAIVRVQMGRLRRLLADYYQGTGAQDPIRIILARGRYAPRFELASGEVLETLPVDTVAEIKAEPEPPEPAATAPAPAPPPTPTPTPAGWRRSVPSWPWLLLILGLIVAALIALFSPSLQSIIGKDEQSNRLQGPLIYVSQYHVLGRDPVAQQLATGLQYDLVNQLAKFPEISVLGLDSVIGSSERDARADPKGANFVLGGAIEIVGTSVRITSQLVRTRDGVILWSDQAIADSVRPATIMKMQANIAATVANKLGQSYGVIAQAMKEELAGTSDPSLEDYKCVLSTYDYMRRKSAEKHAHAQACLEQVVTHSPDYSTAWALLSWVYGDQERYGYDRSPKGDGLERALRAAQQAVLTNPTNPTAHQYLAIARFELGTDDAGARQAIEVALRLSPNNSEILANASWIFAHLDGDDRSRDLGLKAVRLNPGHPSWYWNGLTIYALRRGQKDDALRYARLNNSDQTIWEVYLLAAALRMNGQEVAADTALEKLSQTYPEALRDRERQMRVLRIPAEIKPLIWGKRSWG